jgi:hypothetical protein
MKKYLTSQQRIGFLEHNSILLEESLKREAITTSNLKVKLKEAHDSEWKYQEHIARLTANIDKVKVDDNRSSKEVSATKTERLALKVSTRSFSCDKENCENGT